MEEIANICKL